MKKYTAKEIVERAFKLADLTNTDFITFEEKIDYLNDSWIEVYNAIIAHGDKQFVQEVSLGSPYASTNGYIEYELPFDCYKILSIKDPASGINLERHTESTPNNSATYEVVNDCLRVYGNILAGNLVLTYYVSPLYLSIPNKDLEVEVDEEIISAARNSVLTAGGNIINVVTNEVLGSIAIVEGRNYILGNGHIVETELSETEDYYTMNYLDYDGNVLYTEDVEDLYFYIDEENNIYLNMADADGQIGELQIFGKTTKYKVEPYSNGIVYNDGTISAIEGDFEVVDRFDGNDSFITENGLYSILSDGHIREEKIDFPMPKIDAMTRYGYIVNYGSYRLLKSYIPDTLLNFPNELYFQLIAANMAVRLLMKQNADATGMNSIYENMLSTFRNSLGQEGSYLVVRNAY